MIEKLPKKLSKKMDRPPWSSSQGYKFDVGPTIGYTFYIME